MTKREKREYGRAYRLRTKYNMTVEQYDKLLALQDGVCAICLVAPKKGKRLAVEHCHRSKRVRGLTCSYCNKFRIGRARDCDAELYQRIADYLKSGLDGRTL